MLENAGIAFDAMTPGVDEDAAKAALDAQGLGARDLADALAELKAVRLSLRHPQALVLGADQTLELAGGGRFDKADSLDTLADQLQRLSGATHTLHSAAVVAEGGKPVWRAIDSARMMMRPLSDAFIREYLAAEGEGLLGGVGGYRIEGRGAQLFARVDGSHFTVMGLPLLPLLAYLRERGVVPS